MPVFNLVEQEIVSARGRFKGTSNAGRVLTCRTSRRPLRRFAPRSTLPHQLFDRLRRHEIYIAAYVITDRAILQALTRAADRGVKVRIYLDGAQLPSASLTKPFHDLAETPIIEMRTKRDHAAPMHLKS